MNTHNIGIKHGFSCINIRQVPKEVLKTEALLIHGFSPVNSRLLIMCGTAFYE